MKKVLVLFLSLFTLDAVAAPTIAMTEAHLRALNKRTGRASDVRIAVGEAAMFEAIAVEVMACYTAPDYQMPENAVFARMLEVPGGARGVTEGRVRGRQIFSGWMFSSSPSLSAMEHPHYDLWLVSCGGARMPEPVVIEEPFGEEVVEDLR